MNPSAITHCLAREKKEQEEIYSIKSFLKHKRTSASSGGKHLLQGQYLLVSACPSITHSQVKQPQEQGVCVNE